MNKPEILVSHIGYLCQESKTWISPYIDSVEYFEVQDMNLVDKESLGEYENWQSVFRGKVEVIEKIDGKWLKGDFSSVTTPGIFRIVFPNDQGRSFQFMISDGAFHRLPSLLLDCIHEKRSGNYENEWRGPSHLDDAVRSDNGEFWEADGGWYDAGDLRKWMTTANLPALGFMDVFENLKLKRNHYSEENITSNDYLTESVWAIKFILKMQDPKTGMFFEELGGGGESRVKPGMTWWYENHSGCLADNSQNHFTDNVQNSGDERIIRVTYNPVVQYTSICILLRAAKLLEEHQPLLSKDAKLAAIESWNYTLIKSSTDPLESWTSVKSWKLLAMVELCLVQEVKLKSVEECALSLMDLQDENTGWWWNDLKKKDFFRGILHSAQPLIALLTAINEIDNFSLTSQIKSVIEKAFYKYIIPASATNAFEMMPFGLFTSPSTADKYHKMPPHNIPFRFYMPELSVQRVNHGLAGHWTSWAHALAMAGKMLGIPEMVKLAWRQIDWLTGYNPYNCCLITGVGYRNPMPHSRFLGTLIGGFCAGPRGDAEDKIWIDMDARAEWNNTEYWNVPTANILMALSYLLPISPTRESKIGTSRKK